MFKRKELVSNRSSSDILRSFFNQRRAQVVILHIIFEKIKHLDSIQIEHDFSKRFNSERLEGIYVSSTLGSLIMRQAACISTVSILAVSVGVPLPHTIAE